MTPPTKVIAGLNLVALGDLTPKEKVWINENAETQQRAASIRKYKLVQDLAELINCEEYEALVIINSEPSQRTVEARSALELMAMRQVMAQAENPAEQPKDNDIEYLTFMINSRLAGDRNYTYEEVLSLEEEEKTALFDFFAAEMGLLPAPENEEDPTGKSLNASEPQPEQSPEMSVITG